MRCPTSLSVNVLEDRPRLNRPRMSPGRLLIKPARQATLRESNLSLVAAHIFALDRPISRSQLMAVTGLTRATVSRIVDQLLDASIVEELAPVLGGGAGRPVVPLVPAPNSLVAIGLEINTASVGGCIVDLAGNVIGERVVAGDFLDSDPAVALDIVGDIADDLIDELECRGSRLVGSHFSIPGVIESESQRVLIAPRLGWRDVRPADYLLRHERLLAKPLHLGNVLGFAALAEGLLRRENGVAETFLYIAGDNAVGSALVSDGESITSLYGWDGNVGGTLVDPNGPRCECGSNGCLERFVSRKMMLRDCNLPPSTTIEEVARIAATGTNDRVNSALDLAGDALGIAVATSLNQVSAQTVVFGDNLAVLLPLIRHRIEDGLRARLLTAPLQMPRLEPARTGTHAAMHGGALSTLQQTLENLHAWLA